MMFFGRKTSAAREAGKYDERAKWWALAASQPFEGSLPEEPTCDWEAGCPLMAPNPYSSQGLPRLKYLAADHSRLASQGSTHQKMSRLQGSECPALHWLNSRVHKLQWQQGRWKQPCSLILCTHRCVSSADIVSCETSSVSACACIAARLVPLQEDVDLERKEGKDEAHSTLLLTVKLSKSLRYVLLSGYNASGSAYISSCSEVNVCLPQAFLLLSANTCSSSGSFNPWLLQSQ